MRVKLFTLWNLLPRKFDYEPTQIDEEINQFLQNLTSHLNEWRIFTERLQHGGDGYIDNSMEFFHDSILDKADRLTFVIHEGQIECLEKFVYPRWFLFSMKFKDIRDKVTIVLLGNECRLTMNWDLICHETITVAGNCAHDWSKDFKWTEFSLGAGSNDHNSSDQSTSREISNQITELNLANENAPNSLNKKRTTINTKYSDKTFSDCSDYTSEEYLPIRFTFSNEYEDAHTDRNTVAERLTQSCPDLPTTIAKSYEELRMSFNNHRTKNKREKAKKLFCSMCFSHPGVDDGSLYKDRNVGNGPGLDCNIVKKNKKNKENFPVEFLNDNATSVTEQTISHVTFPWVKTDDERPASYLPPYTEPTDPNSPAFHFVSGLKASEGCANKYYDQILMTNIDYGHPQALGKDEVGDNTDQLMSPMVSSRNEQEILNTITEITENVLNDNSDNTSRIAGNISMSGDSTMSNSSSSNPWGDPDSVVQMIEDNRQSSSACSENPSFLSSSDVNPNSQKIEINTVSSPSVVWLRSNNSSNHYNGISLSGARSPNITTRGVLLTGNSVESDKTRQSRVGKRTKTSQKIPQRKRSISPVYRDDDSRMSYRDHHVSRIDQPITRRRTNSTRDYNEFHPYENGNKFFRPAGMSMTQRQSRNPSLVMPVQVDELSSGDVPTRESSSERRGEIKSTQLPDGGWLTGVFTWLGGSRAATPLIGRRENLQSMQKNMHPQQSECDNTSDDYNEETFNSDKQGPKRIITSSSMNDFQLASPSTATNQESSRRESRAIVPYTSRSEYSYPNRTLQTDFVISLINPISDRPLRHLPRHVYWFYTSVAPTQQRLSQMMAEYRSNIPRVYEKVKSVVSDNRTKIACLFIGTALFVPTAHHLIPMNGELTADAAISYRFGNMISLLRPSLLWTGSAVISKFRPGLYSIRPNL